MPDVSVIIPTYNRLDFLKTAIASCFDGNDGIDIEVVVVDDGSTDGTCEWLREQGDTRVRPIFQEHKGAQHARNAGLESARGDTIKFLDDDDRLLSKALQRQFQNLKRSQALISCGHLRLSKPQDESRKGFFKQEPKPDLVSGIFEGSIWTHPFVFLYERKALEDLWWDPALPYHQDTAFALEVVCRFPKFSMCDHTIGEHTIHQGKRIASRKQKDSVVQTSLAQIRIVEKSLSTLWDSGNIRLHHQKAAVRRMWMYAHMSSVEDFYFFKKTYKKITEINPQFSPKRNSKIIYLMDCAFGVLLTEFVTSFVRKLIK